MSLMDTIQTLNANRAAVEKATQKARARIEAVLDPSSFVELGAFAKSRSTDYNAQPKETPADGVVTGYGTIEDRLVYVYAQDPSVMGGAVGELHAAKIADLINKAVQMGAPVIAMIDSVGLRLTEMTDSLNGYGKIYRAMSKASGVVPMIACVMGQASGGAAVIAGMSDFVVMIDKQSKVFVSSANAMERGTSFDDIASAAVHAEKSGLADLVCEDEAKAAQQLRALFDMLPASNREDAPIYEEEDDLNRLNEALAELEDAEAYDVLPVIAEIADAGTFMELKGAYAPEMVTALIRLNGGTIGVIANNSMVNDGVLTVEGCGKAADFIRFCDAYELPVLTLTNTKGFVAASDEEQKGLAKAAADLAGAFARASVAKVNVICGKAFGSASMIMNAKGIGADVVYAWPSAEISVMNAQSLARILYAKELEEGADLADMTAKAAGLGSAFEAAAHGLVDDVIDPKETRKYLLVAFGMLAGKQELAPAKKHSTR